MKKLLVVVVAVLLSVGIHVGVAVADDGGGEATSQEAAGSDTQASEPDSDGAEAAEPEKSDGDGEAEATEPPAEPVEDDAPEEPKPDDAKGDDGKGETTDGGEKGTPEDSGKGDSPSDDDGKGTPDGGDKGTPDDDGKGTPDDDGKGDPDDGKGKGEVTPVSPTVVQAACKGKGEEGPTPPSITLPPDTELVSYSLVDAETGEPVTTVEPGRTYIVRAVLSTTADPRPVFSSDLPDGWVVMGKGGSAELTITLTVPDCDREEVPPAPIWVDECGPGNGSWEFTDTEAYTYTETVNEDGSITVTATPNEGYTFPEGTVTEWTETDSDEECIVEPPAPVWTDNCDVAGSWAVPPDGEHYHFEVTVGPDGTQTVTLVVDEGYALPPGAVTEWTETEDAENCALVPGDIESQCVSAVPYLSYAVTLPPGLHEVPTNPVTITFVNPAGPDYVVSGQPLSGRLLWPGASATEPLQWPGWRMLPDGTYVETDGNFAWTRQGITVRFDVNPTYSTTVAYPQESSTCANPQRVTDVPPDNPDNPDNPTTPDTPVGDNPPLPNTGGTPLLPAIVGALLAVTGGLLLRLRRHLAA